MADEDQDESQKTEEPTQRRLEEAVKKGQVPTSRELTSFMMLLIFALILIWLAPVMMKHAVRTLTRFIEMPHTYQLDGIGLIRLSQEVLGSAFFSLFPSLALLILIIFLSSLLQHPPILSPEAFMPKLERISPMRGFKRLFSMRSAIEFIKGLFKISIVGFIAWQVVTSQLILIEDSVSKSILAILLLLGHVTLKMMIGVCVFMGLVGILDFLYQKFEYTKSLRMSKRDIRDEYKQTEGSPEVKAKLREIRNKRSQQRMMSAVPKADVVITNPTHYSVALQYDQQKHEAPIVVAKGMDFLALRIREVAKEHNIPIVENAPLARALYASAELEREIPLEHYQAVAEVIRYIYKLKGKTGTKG